MPSEGSKANTDVKCFRCLGMGHFQANCTKEPICYKCKEKGHLAIDCKSKSKKLRMFGFRIPRQGFYAVNFPESRVKTHQSTGLLTILQGEATEEKVDKELRNLVRENWDFKVKQIHLQEYLVVFPDKSSLETFTKLSEFQMSLYGLKGKIERTERDSETYSMLQTIWIKVHGVPELAREVDLMKEIVALVAEPLFVDELSLIKSEPVRVKARCRNPGAIKGSIEIIFNGVGKLIGFEVESTNLGASRGGKGGPTGSGKPEDRSNRDKDKPHKEDNTRRSLGKFDRLGKIDKEAEAGYEESMEEEMEKMGQLEGEPNAPVDNITPIAAFHPSIGLVSILVTAEKSPQVNLGLEKK